MTTNVADKFLEYAVNARAAYGTNNSATAPAINGWKAVMVDSFRATRTFSGTPLNAHVGELALKVTATDTG